MFAKGTDSGQGAVNSVAGAIRPLPPLRLALMKIQDC